MNDLKGKAPMGVGDMSMFAEEMKTSKNTLGPINALIRSMVISKMDVDEEEVEVKHAMEASVRSAQ